MIPVEVSIGSATYDWWDLVPAIVGGVIGALAGGIPAWLLARRASKETAEREQISREEQQIALLFRLHAKLGIILNDLSSTLLQIREMLDRPLPSGHPAPNQGKISAFAGKHSDPDVTFKPDELSVLLAYDEADFLTDLDLLGRRYAAILSSLETYSQLKSELHSFLGNQENVSFGDDYTFSTPLKGASASNALTKMATLESLITTLIARIEGDLGTTVELVERWTPTLKPHFPNRKIPGFELSEFYKLFPEYKN